MNLNRSEEMTLPNWVVIANAILIGILLVAVSLALGSQLTTKSWQIIVQLTYEVGKALFIGGTAGAFIKYILPKEKESKSPLQQCGIDALYTSRAEAGLMLLDAVRDPKTQSVSMIGISLREFLFPTGTLHDVWDALSERLKLEARSRTEDHDRLRVRLLLLDPTCPEGDFRVQVEKNLPFKLNVDGPACIQTVIGLCNELGGGTASRRDCPASFPPILEARLYQHGSFAFQFITDSFALVEQYTYHDHAGGKQMPILQYRRYSGAYEKLANGYEIMWTSARIPQGDELKVGVGKALRESRLTGVFRQDDRNLLTIREKQVLTTCRPGDIVAIQALSGRFYMQQIIGDIEKAASPSGRSAKIRFLVINPVSRGAILRAVADSTPIEDIRSALRNWTWEKHTACNLYNDVDTAIRRVEALMAGECDVEIRLSASDLPFAMLLTSDSLFVEQYALGRSKSFVKGLVLGGEYAVNEHERGGYSSVTSEERILESAFEVLWDSCSMSAKRYLKDVNKRDSFEAELTTLLAQLDPEPNPDELCMVILAAGYGVRFASEGDRIPGLQGKPKALLPVKGRPILEWLLECVKDIKEITKVVLVTNERFFDHFVDWRRGAVEPAYHSIRIISDGTKTNSERRGAIGALHFAITREEINGNVLVVGADNFFAGDFKEIVEEWRSKRKGIVVVHDEGSTDRIAGRLGVVTVDNQGEIIDFEEKPENPKGTLASTLCYVLTEQNLRHLKGYVREQPRADNSGEFIRHLAKEGAKLNRYEFKGKWFDVGTLSEYESLCKSI